jgi:hypothetical protein
MKQGRKLQDFSRVLLRPNIFFAVSYFVQDRKLRKNTSLAPSQERKQNSAKQEKTREREIN